MIYRGEVTVLSFKNFINVHSTKTPCEGKVDIVNAVSIRWLNIF